MWNEMQQLMDTGAEVSITFRKTEAFATPAYHISVRWLDRVPNALLQRYVSEEQVKLCKTDVAITEVLREMLKRYEAAKAKQDQGHNGQ